MDLTPPTMRIVTQQLGCFMVLAIAAQERTDTTVIHDRKHIESVGLRRGNDALRSTAMLVSSVRGQLWHLRLSRTCTCVLSAG